MKQKKQPTVDLLQQDTYDGLLKLLNAQRDDQVVAFEILENMKKKDPFMLLLLMKESNLERWTWTNNTPKSVKALKKQGHDIDSGYFPPSWEDLYKFVKTEEQAELFRVRLENFYNAVILKITPVLISDFEIILKAKKK